MQCGAWRPVITIVPCLLSRQTPDGCDPVLSQLVAKCFAADPRARPDFHEIFAALNNYHKELESTAEQEATRVVMRPHNNTDDGGRTARGGGTNSGTSGTQAEDSEDSASSSDDCSSSGSGGEDDFEQMEMILQYARVGPAFG
jgi:hypothetical protein